MSSSDGTAVYRVLSKFYDLFDLIFLLGGKGSPRPGLLDVIGPADQQILDVCVGTAASALIVAAHRTSSRIVGVDVSDDMLAVGRRKVLRKGLSNVELMHASADDMPFGEDVFDVAMVSFALHEFEPELRDRTLREILRVLKPDGRLCVLDFARQQGVVNRWFLGAWGVLEPACFSPFLDPDWREYGKAYGLRLDSEADYSFSRVWVFSKTSPATTR